MKLTIDFTTESATANNKTVKPGTAGLYTILYNGAFSTNVTGIHILKEGFITSKIIKAVKVCLVRGIEVIINTDYIADFEALKPYEQAIFDFIEGLEVQEETAKVLDIIVHNRELIAEYAKGIDNLHLFLDAYVQNSGFDVSMASATSYDKLSNGVMEDSYGHKVEWSRNYTAKYTVYHTSLLDKLNMYLNVKWYIANGFEPERIDKDADIVVPVSACSEYLQMYVS